MPTPIPLPLALESRVIGHPLRFLREVDSTNQQLRELAEQGATHGTTLVADYQQAGRGRRDRQWQAPRGSSLLVSLLLRPPAPALERLSQLPLVIGVAVAQTLEQHLALSPTLKWPNDIQVGGKKVGGILIEALSQGDSLAAIVGIGLNVSQRAATLAALPDATSLALATGERVERGPLLAALLLQIEQRYEAWLGGWMPHEEWSARAPLLGRALWVHPSDGGDAYPATALSLAPDGALIVERPDGSRYSLHAADVSVRLSPPSDTSPR